MGRKQWKRFGLANGRSGSKGEEAYELGVPILKEAFKGAPDWLAAPELENLNSLLKILRDGLAEDLHMEVEPVRGWG